MKNSILSLVMMLLLGVLPSSAQKFTKAYVDEPMPNVLRDIDEVYAEGNINFIFNELEDFTVTANVKNKTVLEAVYEVVGFYPIKVTRSGTDIYLECWQKEANKLKGCLLDENMRPVEFANVQLFNPEDTTFITGGVSNSNGDFVIPCDEERVLLKTHCIGYMPYSRVYEVGSIGIVRVHTNAKLLREIKVEQRQVEYNGDKITSYPTATQLEHSYDIYSLLNQQPFPGLYVNEWERSVSTFGGAPVVLVDGVKRSVKDLISIQPKNIKKIEYSLTVPLKYQGASGVIYIYLKEPKMAGGSFYAQAQSALTTGFVIADAGASYNQGKSQFTLDYTFNLRDYDERVVNLKQSYVGDDFRVDLNEVGEPSTLYYDQHDIRVGYSYRHDKTTVFQVRLNNEMFSGTTEENGYVQDSYLGNYKRTTSKNPYSYMPSLDLYFQKEIKGGQRIEAQVVGSLIDRGYERIYDDELENGEKVSYPSNVNTDHLSLVSEVSYSKLFGKNTSLSTGIKNEISRSENTYVNNDYKSELKKNDSYMYINLSQRVGKMSLNAGTGLKYIKMTSELNERDFLRNMTTLSFAGSPKKNFYVGLSGGYMPIVPSLSNLTELEQIGNGYLRVNGNPNLKTSHRFNGRLALSPSFGRFGFMVINQVNYVIDPVYSNVTYKGAGKFLQRSENYENLFHYQGRLVFTLNEVLNKHLTARVDLFYNHYRTQDIMWRHHLNSFGMNCSVTGYFGKWNVSVNYKKAYKTLDAETISSGESGATINVGWRPNKHWVLRAGCMNIFQPRGFSYPVEILSKVNPATGEAYIRNNGNMITLSVQYKLAFGKLFGKTKRTLNNRGSGAAVLTL